MSSLLLPPSKIWNEKSSVDDVRNDFFDVTSKLAKDRPSLFAKTIYTILDCFRELNLIPNGQEKNFEKVGDQFRLIKLSCAPGAFCSKANDFRRDASEYLVKKDRLWSYNGMCDVLHLTRSANSCVSHAWESTDLITKLMEIPKKTIETFKGIAGISLILGMGFELSDSLKRIHGSNLNGLEGKAYDTEWYTIRDHLTKIAKNVSYLALGILTVLSVFFQFVFAPAVFVALTASTVVFGILEYYQKELGEKKVLKKVDSHDTINL